MSSAAYIAPNTTSECTGDSLYRKIAWRLMPILVIGYIIAYIDRVNVSFAAAQMSRDLAFSAYVYGLGAGIFFLGYSLFEVPSNLILHKVGGRRWLARIMITWAIIAGAMASVKGATGFYVLRFLLGEIVRSPLKFLFPVERDSPPLSALTGPRIRPSLPRPFAARTLSSGDVASRFPKAGRGRIAALAFAHWFAFYAGFAAYVGGLIPGWAFACAVKSDGGGKRRLSSKRASIACVLMAPSSPGVIANACRKTYANGCRVRARRHDGSGARTRACAAARFQHSLC